MMHWRENLVTHFFLLKETGHVENKNVLSHNPLVKSYEDQKVHHESLMRPFPSSFWFLESVDRRWSQFRNTHLGNILFFIQIYSNKSIFLLNAIRGYEITEPTNIFHLQLESVKDIFECNANETAPLPRKGSQLLREKACYRWMILTQTHETRMKHVNLRTALS